MNQPLISVVVPVRNSENTVAEALDSICNQTYKNLEILVVDDFSSDHTRAIVETYQKKDGRIQYLHMLVDDPERFDERLNRNINAGYAAKNFGFDRAKGDFITSQDADDVSLLNRIEVQYSLLKEHSAQHVSLDLVGYDPESVGKKLDVESYIKARKLESLGPKDLYKISQKTKGVIIPFLGPLNKKIPFYYKRARVINKLFFGSLEAFPGAGNTCMFKREILIKVHFRSLRERIWPSFMGRGSDRDFNFQIAEAFHNSYVFFLPLYLWRKEVHNPRHVDYKKFLI